MDQFVVSARKYRPSTFDTVVGQHSITSTLKNAINNNHLAQAFLFCGPRGVGKTTCARILAKTINCQSLTDKTEACNTCESCKSFNEGKSLNIHELDAASNNSVDDIRHLIDQVRFAPQMGDYKVYIIDEVHMLSSAAFNAFLKTLEEPPAHAIFILATTEKHKIIPTILSRCQIFDFRRIQIEDITSHLENIAGKEKVEAEREGLSIIAQKADGALRDALSIFDQIVSFSGNSISYQDVIDNLNILDYEYYFKITDFAIEKNVSGCLLTFDEILDKGFNGHNFIVGLAEHYRNLLVCKDDSTVSLIEVGEKIKAKYQEQSTKCSADTLMSFLNICNTCDLNYKGSKNHRLQVEIALLQLCSLELTDEKKKTSPLLALPKVLQFKSPQNGNTPPVQLKSNPINPENSPEKKELPKQPTVVESIAPQPKINPSLKKVSLGGHGFSIKKALNAEEKKQELSEDGEMLKRFKDDFTEEQLIVCWKKYAKKLKKEGKESFYSTLMKHLPSLKDNYQIHIVLENNVQSHNVEIEKIDLLMYLKDELRNDHISLEYTVTEIKDETTVYTSRDKYNRMLEKNPAIKLLKERLDLDIDY